MDVRHLTLTVPNDHLERTTIIGTANRWLVIKVAFHTINMGPQCPPLFIRVQWVSLAEAKVLLTPFLPSSIPTSVQQEPLPRPFPCIRTIISTVNVLLHTHISHMANLCRIMNASGDKGFGLAAYRRRSSAWPGWAQRRSSDMGAEAD